MGSWTRTGWLVEGDFIRILDEDLQRYFVVDRRDFAHVEWEFGWPDIEEADRPIAPGDIAGPYSFNSIKPTKWSEKTRRFQMFQFIWGQKPDVKVYIQLPSETKRHGTPKLPWFKKGIMMTVAHFTMQMSPFDRPTFFTEHFLVPKLCDEFGFEVYNPLPITVTPYFNFYINKLEMRPIGDVTPAGERIPASPETRNRDVLENLYKRVAKYRPITLFPVTAPASTR